MSFAMAYGTKKRNQVSQGGHVRSAKRAFDHAKNPNASSPSIEREMGRESMESAKQVARERAASAPKTGYDFAEGGEVSEHEQDADMIARIMHKRKEYAQGGVVANDVGVAEADEKPAEFDDLVLDDHLEADDSGSNEIGDPEGDPVSRAMKKRRN